jgi:D-aminopeptidase
MRREAEEEDPAGSCMVVVATDAPLDSHNLKRLAQRALLGIPRTGGFYTTGSGDYCVAFSAAEGVRFPHRTKENIWKQEILRTDRMTSLFLAAAEASEEAILNSLFKATTMEGKNGRKREAIPLDKVRAIIDKAPKR